METDDAALCAQIIKEGLAFFDSIRDVRINDPLPQGVSRAIADSLADSLNRARTGKPKWREMLAEFLTRSGPRMIAHSRLFEGLKFNPALLIESAVKSHFQMQFASQMEWQGVIPDLNFAPILNWEFRREGEPEFERTTCPLAQEAMSIALDTFSRARGIKILDPLPPPLDRDTVDRILLHGRQIPPELKEGFERGIADKMRSFARSAPTASAQEIALGNIQACAWAFVVTRAFRHLTRAPLSVIRFVPAIELISNEAKEVERGHRN